MEELLGMAIFMGARPFSLFDDTYFKQIFNSLDINLPDRHTIAGPILTRCYESTRKKLLSELQGEPYLNVSFDEATNVSNSRVISLSFSTQKASFFYCMEDIGDRTFNAQAIVDWIYTKIGAFLAEQKMSWKSINSISTDTAAVMRASWSILMAMPDLNHVFCIPCDSHGLQLLIKDLLHLPSIQPAFQATTNIINYFRNASKQLQVLHSHQMKAYGKKYCLITPVITRWGSQFAMLHSLKRSEAALKSWAAENTEGSKEISISLLNRDLWLQIDDLISLLKPIHEAQRMSESQKSHIMLVANRWIKIQEHFEKQLSHSIFSEAIRSYLYDEGSTWNQRFKRQMSSLHWVAYYLHPRHAYENVPLSPALIPEIEEILERYGGQQALKDFFYFRSKQEAFRKDNIWKQLDPNDFWIRISQTTDAKALASLALRLFNTVANSVASERSFSAMGLQHTNIQNKLDTEQTNKLIFISMNTRVLDRLHGVEPDVNSIDSTPEDDIQIEERRFFGVNCSTRTRLWVRSLRKIDLRLPSQSCRRCLENGLGKPEIRLNSISPRLE